MDINVLRGLMTLVLMIAFLGLVFWAYSKNRKPAFDEAANLPFADEEHEDKPNQGISSSLEKKTHA